MEPELASLDDPRYDELIQRDFVFHQYSTDDGGALIIKHEPSGAGRAQRIREMGTGRRFHDARRAMIDSLTAELREKGVRPPLPLPGVKKIGKPRWAKRSDSDVTEAVEMECTENTSAAE